MIPENSGVGVIAHETGQTTACRTSTTPPTRASRRDLVDDHVQGSYGGDNTNGIGNRPVDFDAWDKWQLGWLDPAGRRSAEGRQVRDQARAGRGEHEAGPGRLREAAGDHQDDQGRRADERHPRVVLGHGRRLQGGAEPHRRRPRAGTTSLSYKTWYEAELDYDYVFVQASTDGGLTWTRCDVHRHVRRVGRRRVRQRSTAGGADVDLRLGRPLAVSPASRSAPLQVRR